MIDDQLDQKVVEILNDQTKSHQERGEILLNTPQMQQLLKEAEEAELGRNPDNEPII